LPESHGCPGLQEAKADARRKIAQSFTGQYEPEEEQEGFLSRLGSRRRRSKRKRFSEQEKKELMIASILVLLVGISALGFPYGIIVALTNLMNYISQGFGLYIILSPVIFLISFMVHEMAHKFTAQHYGMWAEFRMTTAGYYMSAIAIVFSIPIFGTGVVMSSGAASTDEDAKVNLAGPLSNLVLGSIMSLAILGIALSTPSTIMFLLVMIVLRPAVILNGMLGLFNMIPIQPFDGGTVFRWNKAIYGIVTIGLIFVVLMGYIGVSMLFL
jgi:Zn-dependent protease